MRQVKCLLRDGEREKMWEEMPLNRSFEQKKKKKKELKQNKCNGDELCDEHVKYTYSIWMRLELCRKKYFSGAVFCLLEFERSKSYRCTIQMEIDGNIFAFQRKSFRNQFAKRKYSHFRFVFGRTWNKKKKTWKK